MLLVLVPLNANSFGDKGLNIVWSTVALIKDKAGSNKGSLFNKEPVEVKVPVSWGEFVVCNIIVKVYTSAVEELFL